MTAREGEGFPKATRIRRRREFLSMGRTGLKRRTEHFVLLLQRTGSTPRLGITVSRKVGGAVARNLLKRRIREAFRRHESRASFGYDVIVIAKPGSGAVSMPAVSRALAEVVDGRRALGPDAGRS